MINDNTELEKSQDLLLEKEIEEKFTPKRQYAELLAQSYDRLGYESKSARVSECGTFLEFRRALSDPADRPPARLAAEGVGGADRWRLHSANFCRDRLCPMCSWRRSYKIFAQVSQIMNAMPAGYEFIFLTLTVPNCAPDELSDTINQLQKGWRLLSRSKRFKTAVCGFFKVLEITRNKVNGTFHPHFHCILAVKDSYFKGRDYIQQSEWLALWRKAMKDESITQVDVRKCKPKDEIKEGEEFVKALSSAVAEVAKYSVKSGDYIIPDDLDQTDDSVFWLSAALNHRRLCALGGLIDDVRKQLMLDDCEEGDLINVDGTEIRADVSYMIRRYSWSAGVYKLLQERREVNILMEVSEDE